MISQNAGTPLSGGNNNTMSYNDRTISFQTIIGDKNFLDLYGLKIERDNHVTNYVQTYLNHQALTELGLDEDAESYPYYKESEPIAGIFSDFHIRTILESQQPLRVVFTVDENLTPW